MEHSTNASGSGQEETVVSPTGHSEEFAQQRVSNPTKEAWVLDSLKKRRTEFLHKQQIRAFVGTWNVNGKAPPADLGQLTAWLGFVPDNEVELEKLPELVVLGFQELDVRAEAFVYNNSVKDMEWTEAVERSMGGAKQKLVKAASKQLIGMFIMVYVRTDMVDVVTDVKMASVGCGIMGMVGNKGAVAVRLTFRDTPMCFVCAHLAHDGAQVERRNAQFHDLSRRLTFAGSAADADPLTPSADVVGSGATEADRMHSVFDHSYVVWFGDLNYRLAIDTGDMDEILARGEHRSLLGLDQLQIVRMNKQAFAGFEEGHIDFAPTYKYIVGTSEYDVRRRPAWCDRVLWWTRPGCEDGVQSEAYESVDSVCTSDHKPVRAQLGLDVWRVDVEQRRAVFLEVLRELDRYENECIPTANVEATTVDFGDVYFGRAVRRQLRVGNSGQVPLEYGFVATPNRAAVAPGWLRITPEHGMLLPGQHVDVELVISVDERTSAPLSTRQEDLDDILVLHLTRGRDYFIQVHGAYQVSVYGMSLDVLVHCKGAVRNMTRADFEQCLRSGQFSVPRSMWLLIDFLSRYGVDRGLTLFNYSGDSVLGRRIREWLDTDQPLDPGTILQWPEGGDAQGSSRMSLTDQTLVASAISDIDVLAPSTAEALEQLSLGTWTPTPMRAESDSESEPDLEPDSHRHLSSGQAAEAIAGRAAHDAGVDTVASCLVELLRALPSPLIPTALYTACIEAGGHSRAAALEALEVLPPGNLNVLVYLLAFLREAVERGATAAARVARVFAPALLRPPVGHIRVDAEDGYAEMFVLYLLQSHGQI